MENEVVKQGDEGEKGELSTGPKSPTKEYTAKRYYKPGGALLYFKKAFARDHVELYNAMKEAIVGNGKRAPNPAAFGILADRVFGKPEQSQKVEVKDLRVKHSIPRPKRMVDEDGQPVIELKL